LAGHDRPDDGEVDEDDEELSNSGVSTVNSAKIKHTLGKEQPDFKFWIDQVKALKLENSKLITDLVEFQKQFQTFLKTQSTTSEVFVNFFQQLSIFTRGFDRSVSFGYFSDDMNNRKSNDASPSLDETDKAMSAGNTNSKKLHIPPLFKNPQLKSPLRQCHDVKLVDWLVRHGFDEESRSAVSSADFTYEDFVYESDKDDIRRIGLR